jgi:hypothetical protein
MNPPPGYIEKLAEMDRRLKHWIKLNPGKSALIHFPPKVDRCANLTGDQIRIRFSEQGGPV